MVVELPAAMLACARIGAVHSVVFGGFSAEALAGRIEDARSTVVLTCSAVMRGPKASATNFSSSSFCEECRELKSVLCILTFCFGMILKNLKYLRM